MGDDQNTFFGNMVAVKVRNGALAVDTSGANGTGTAIDQTTPATAFVVPVNRITGAAHSAHEPVTAGVASAPLAIARPTRRGITISNTDASITVYFGTTTPVTSANGFTLKAGQSINVTTVEALYVIAASGTPRVDIFDEYD